MTGSFHAQAQLLQDRLSSAEFDLIINETYFHPLKEPTA
jgi:hypothetical protein